MAKDPLGHEGRASEKGKWQQDEACQRDQFELDDRDEDLDRQDEESDHDNQPGNEQDQDLYKVGEEANRPDKICGRIKQRLSGVEPGGSNNTRAQKIADGHAATARLRSEEHTSELQSLMRISYDVFCLKKKKNQ